jgi:hypothetical protein
MHSLLNHGLEHMRRFDGIGDTLEDDIKHMHQMSARIELRIFMHSKIEVVQNFAIVQEKIVESKAISTRVMKRRNPEACANTRAKRAKEERDQRRAMTLTSIDNHTH